MAGLRNNQNHMEQSKTRFEKKIDKLRIKNKCEFQIEFVRTKSNSGKFTTKANIIRGSRSNEVKKAGLLHSLDYSARNRVHGDIPSITKQIDSFMPKTKKGKVFHTTVKATNFIVHDAGRTALDVGLAAETATIASSKTALNKATSKLGGMYEQQAQDDMNKAAIYSSKLIFDGSKGLKNHFKQRKNAKLLKTEFKLKKAESKYFQKFTYKEERKAIQSKLKLKKNKFKDVKTSYKNSSKSNIRKALYKARKAKFKQEKKSFTLDKNDLKDKSNSFKLDKKSAKREFKIAKPTPVLFKMSGYGVHRLKASAQQKLLIADEHNDMLRGADKGYELAKTGTDKVKEHYSVKNRLEKKNQQIRKFERKDHKLQQKSDRLEKKISSASSQNDKNKYQKKFNKLSKKEKKSKEKLKKLKKSKASLVAFSTLGSSVLTISIAMLFLMTVFNGTLEAIFGNSGWVMGTYTAQDKYLSQAEEYYTKIAYEFNQKLLMVSDKDKWKKGLNSFNVVTEDMDDEPDQWIWGNSTIFDYDPVYDFDTFKLWSFLCAYYFDFQSTKDKETRAEYWEYDSDVEKVIKALFDAEYKFEYWYDNTSRWEELSPYNYWGGGSADSGTYYRCEKDAYMYTDQPYRYRFKPIAYTSELGKYRDDDGYICIDSNYRVLDPKNKYKVTGFYIMDNRYYSGTSKPFYLYDRSADKFYFKQGSSRYDRSFWGWDSEDAWFMISPTDTHIWNYTLNDVCMYGYYEKYYWKTDCRLYYNVKRKNTFDKAIKNTLTRMDYGSERYQMYEMFLGTAEDSKTTRGNHQTFANPIGGSIQDSIDNGNILNGYGYDIQEWNTKHCSLYDENESHQGIDIICNQNTSVYAGMSGTIDEIDRDNDLVVIRKNSYNYWYDGDGKGKKRDTKIYYYNISAKNSLKEGDTIKKGDYIGLSLPEHKCEKISNDSVGCYYIHLRIEIDTDGFGWDYIDPRLVLE